MNAIPKDADLKAGMIAAYRYLAFLKAERTALLRELQPEWEPGKRAFFPVDVQVYELHHQEPVLDRCERVLRALGLDPHRHDAWVDVIGMDMATMPVLKLPM